MMGNHYDESDPSTWDDENINDLDKTDNKIEEPIIESTPVENIEPTIKLVSPYSGIDESKLYINDLTQYLPNQLLTEEDLGKCVEQCVALAKQHSSDSFAVANLKSIIDAFQHISFNTFGKEYTSFFTKNVGRLVQHIEGLNGSKLRMNYQDITIDNNSEIIRGDSALRYLAKITSTGRPIKIYLWHSGIWLTLSPFTENELLDLNIALQDEKQTLGRDTLGAIFSGDDIHIVGTIVEFILTHIENDGCNIKDYSNINKLKKLIKVSDIPALLVGALAAIYPDGYPVYHPCVNTRTEVKCTYNLTPVLKENGDFKPDSKLSFNKMLYTNPQYFNQEDIRVFSALSKTIESKDAIALQDRLSSKVGGNTRKQLVWSINIGENDKIDFYVGFKTPNIEEYLNSATAWVNEVKQMADEAVSINSGLSLNDREAKREKHLASYAAVTELVKHSGWVKYFSIVESNGTERIINDEDTIKRTLKQYAMIDGFTDGFNKALQDYKEDSIIAWVGIPNYECPECKCGQTSLDSKTPTLIPINPVSYFFSTMVFRGRSRHLLTT